MGLDFLRQWWFPAALRVDPAEAAAPWPDLAALLRTLDPGTVQGATLDDAALARLATLAWRMAILVPRFGGHAAARSLANRAEALSALVSRLGVETIDFSGQDFDPGQLWDEVVSDGVPPEGQPFIESMQLPLVRHRGRTLQRGIPIVADRRQTGGPA